MKRIKLVITLCLLSVAGCLGGCQGSSLVPSAAYVTQDRNTYKAVKEITDKAKVDHPDLARGINDTMKSWDARVSAAEKVAPK